VDRPEATGGLPQLVEAERCQRPELAIAHERIITPPSAGRRAVAPLT
jgi:hypothetical protein